MIDNDRANILMVDDQPGKLLSYEVILRELNENLIQARSAREALDHQFPGHGVCFPAERAERSGGFRSPIETQPPDAGPRLSVRQSHRVGYSVVQPVGLTV